MRLGLPLFLVAAGCSGEPSSLFATGDIEATMRITNNAATTATVEVILRNTSGQYLQLDTDELAAAFNGGEEVLEQTTEGVITYGGDFDMGSEATEFEIVFRRDSGDDTSSLLTVPAPIEFGTVTPTVSSEEDLEVAWTGGSGFVQVLIDGDCVETLARDVDTSAGSLTVLHSEFVQTTGTSCPLEIQLFIENDGTPDPLWREGSVATGRALRRETLTTYQP